MRWAVEIQESSLERRNLHDLLMGLGFQLIECDPFALFTSPSINQLGTAKEVWNEAKHLHNALTGPAEIDKEFRLGSVIDYSTQEPKRCAFLEVDSLQQSQFIDHVELTISPPKSLSEVQLAQWLSTHDEQQYQAKLEAQRAKLEPAFWSSRASKLLELLAIDNPTGEILYKIYELMEGDPSNRSTFHNRFDVSSDQFDRFRDSVHNPRVSGDWARHAYGKNPRTSDPMSEREAETFVRELSAKWLASVRTARSDV